MSITKRDTKNWKPQYVENEDYNTFIANYGEGIASTMKIIPMADAPPGQRERDAKRVHEIYFEKPKFSRVPTAPLEKKKTKEELALEKAGVKQLLLF